MAYIGEKPSQTLASPTSQYFNGDGSTVAFTLNRAVNVAEDLEVFVNNIQQEPGVGKSYTATGTTLTFDAAPSSGTNNVYVVYRGLAEVTTRLEHDANAALAATTGTFSGDLTVDTNTLYVDSTNNRVGIGTTSPSYELDVKSGGEADIRIDSATSNDGALRFAENGTNVFTMYHDAANSALAWYDNSNLSERMRIDASGIVTKPYQPSFLAGNPNSTFTGATGVDGSYSGVIHNVGNHYNSSNGRFTAPVSGTYHFWHQVSARQTTNSGYEIKLYKNTTVELARVFNHGSGSYHGGFCSATVYLNANDYVQPGFYNGSSVVFSGNADIGGGQTDGTATGFGGFLIG